jgi:hypothetical protein
MKFPKKVFVYFDECDGEMVLMVEHDLALIPEHIDRQHVATYKFKRREQFIVRRILK